MVVRGSLLLFDATGDWIRLRAREYEHFPELFGGPGDLSDRADKYLANWLRAKIADGALVDHDSDAMADVLFGSISSHWQREPQRTGRRHRVDRDRFVAAWVDLAIRLTANKTKAAS